MNKRINKQWLKFDNVVSGENIISEVWQRQYTQPYIPIEMISIDTPHHNTLTNERAIMPLNYIPLEVRPDKPRKPEINEQEILLY